MRTFDDRSLSLIHEVPLRASEVGTYRRLGMAVVIHSRDAGMNRLTFDLIFNSGENCEIALNSNVFTTANSPRLLG